MRFCIFANSSTGHEVWITGNEYQGFGKRYDMKQEINPQDSPRGFAFELWKTAGMPKVTIFKTFDISECLFRTVHQSFLAWGKYRRGLFKTTLPISFQFHHAQMDGFEAARFLNGLQETINGLKTR